MSKRTAVPAATETEVLVKSGRRCAVCVAQYGDTSIKHGQIAHLDHDPSNNRIQNLCFLCLEHHDQYDSSTRLSKGLTIVEVRLYREKLYAALSEILLVNSAQAGDVDISASIHAGSGEFGPGGDVHISGGAGRHIASGGDVSVGPGTYKAGDGGLGKGGDLYIKGGDSE